MSGGKAELTTIASLHGVRPQAQRIPYDPQLMARIAGAVN